MRMISISIRMRCSFEMKTSIDGSDKVCVGVDKWEDCCQAHKYVEVQSGDRCICIHKVEGHDTEWNDFDSYLMGSEDDNDYREEMYL